MNYTIIENNDGIFVQRNDQAIVGGPYKNIDSAKRRIRHLKTTEAAAPEVKVVAAEPVKVVEKKSWPVGVFPAIPKKAYRQRWAA